MLLHIKSNSSFHKSNNVTLSYATKGSNHKDETTFKTVWKKKDFCLPMNSAVHTAHAERSDKLLINTNVQTIKET